jgi:cytochrome b561
MTYGVRSGGYPTTSKWLHWLIAACVLVMIPIGIVMGRVGQGPTQDTLYLLHKSLGMLILMLMLARLVNRIVIGAPAPAPSLARWQRVASSATHGLLYVLLLVMPIGGWLANSAYGAPTPFFGVFEIPNLIAKNEALADRLFALHRSILLRRCITSSSIVMESCSGCCRALSAATEYENAYAANG